MGHIHELYDFTVSAFIVYGEKLLLLHHKKLNTWLQPGGHVELDEDLEGALWREVQEETGLSNDHLEIIELTTARPTTPDAKRLPIPFDMNVHKFGNDPHHKHIDLAYFIKSDTDEIMQNPDESNDLKWFTRNDIEAIKGELLPDIYERAMFVLNAAF